MKEYKLSSITLDSTAKIIAEYINEGRLVIIPTDTAYGISTNALDEKAVKKVFTVKNRKLGEALNIGVANVDMATKYAEISESQYKVMKRILPGAVTFILKKKDNLPSILTGGLNTVGIRIPATSFITVLSNYLEIPYTTTSANYSGKATPYNIDEIKNQFDEETLHHYFSAIVETKDKLLGKASTIVDITDISNPKIIRKGAIKGDEILHRIKRILA